MREAVSKCNFSADAKRGRLSIGNHEELSLFLRSKNVIQTESVYEAFALTDRGFYAGNQKRLEQMKTKTGEEAVKTSTYWDRPLGIGKSDVTCTFSLLG